MGWRLNSTHTLEKCKAQRVSNRMESAFLMREHQNKENRLLQADASCMAESLCVSSLFHGCTGNRPVNAIKSRTVFLK